MYYRFFLPKVSYFNFIVVSFWTSLLLLNFNCFSSFISTFKCEAFLYSKLPVSSSLFLPSTAPLKFPAKFHEESFRMMYLQDQEKKESNRKLYVSPTIKGGDNTVSVPAKCKTSLTENLSTFSVNVSFCVFTLSMVVNFIFLLEPVNAANSLDKETQIHLATTEASEATNPTVDLNPNPKRKKPTITNEAIRDAKLAFQAYDNRDLDKAENLFSKAINVWRDCTSCRSDEIASLIKVRGNVRVDLKKFSEAISDYNEVVAIMESSFNTDISSSSSAKKEMKQGTSSSMSPIPNYSEYADVFAQRGLAYEGLSQWETALSDYNKAISLWGDGRSEDINPFVLTFRGNCFSKLNNYKEAIKDYQAAGDIFLKARDDIDANFVRTNYALAQFELGESAEAKKVLQDVVRRDRGNADSRVALAAIAWAEGDLIEAEKQWSFTCDNINVGCKFYKDKEWVQTVRRWPPSMSNLLDNFLERKSFATKKPSLTLQEQIQLR